MKFVVLHGSFGSPSENWIPWLKRELERAGHTVVTPQLPVDEYGAPVAVPRQNLKSWLEAMSEYHAELNGAVVVAHSIAPLFLLHYLQAHPEVRLSGAALVCPFLDSFKGEPQQFYAVNRTFYEHNFDYNTLRTQLGTSICFYSDNDPYIPEQDCIEFADVVAAEKSLLPRAGHINLDAGFAEFPQLLAWLNDAAWH